MTYKFVPFTIAWDDNVPIDLSFVFEREKPAGKHGFVTVKGEKLAFEDGTEARFWGSNFNSGANFPSHAYSEMVAKRLAKFGVNIVRTHQMDAEWATPNLFTRNRARPKDNTRSFDPECIDRLDYLIYCLKQEGIYMYLDLLTYRHFLPGDEVDAVDQLSQAAKPYTYFDPRLIKLQKEFNRDLWTHTNPYTKLAYKDEPSIALSELQNESDPFAYPVLIDPYRSRLESQYRSWSAERGLFVSDGRVDFAHFTPQVARFLTEVMKAYNQEMIAHLREIGVKIPINGTNWSINLGVAEAQTVVDFADTHTYWNFPTWENPNGTDPKPMVGEVNTTLGGLSFMRLQGKPLFISEWDHAWPDPFRAESSLWYAAISALQGWSGMTIHTYRYSTWEAEDRIGGGGETINGITYRNHFDAGNDPAKFGLFPQAALILRRGDVREAETKVSLQIPAGDEWLLKRPDAFPELNLATEKHRVSVGLPGQPIQADRTIQPGEEIVSTADGQVVSDTGQLGRDWKKRYGWIDTPRTQAAYGFLGSTGEVKLSSLNLNIETEFATIALSSLTDESIEETGFLLLTAVGKCDNTGAEYSPDGKRQTSYGHPPVLVQAIQGKIAIRTTRPALKVWVISHHGEVVTRLPTQYEDGMLKFEIGPQPDCNPSTIYYLIRL